MTSVPRQFALGFAVLLALKPVIDFGWAVKLPLGQFAVSPQAVLGALTFFFALLLASHTVARRDQSRGLIIGSTVFLAVSAYIGWTVLRQPSSLQFSLKYLSSLSALVLVPWTYQTLSANGSGGSESLFEKLVLTSFALLSLSFVLQMFGVIPWQVYDNLPEHDPKSLTTLVQVGRLTGFYYHPLDVMRVLVWVWAATVYCAFFLNRQSSVSRKMAYLILFLCQFFIVGTTHRTSILVTMFIFAGVTLLTQNWKTGLKVLSTAMLAWATAIVAFSAVSGRNMLGAFAPWHAVNITMETETRIARQSKAPEPDLKERISNANIGHGRSFFWRQHISWIRSFSGSELLTGTTREYPPGQEREPHNQLLDIIERYGILGFFLLTVAYGFAIWTAPVAGLWKLLTLLAFFMYGTVTEILVAPTFSWWGLGFLFLPVFSNRFKSVKRVNPLWS